MTGLFAHSVLGIQGAIRALYGGLAYIDPGTGSLVFQMLIAGLLGVAVAFRNLRAWVARHLAGIFGRRHGSSGASGAAISKAELPPDSGSPTDDP